jgi:predicted RecA/RadA family phage recombinase
MKNFIAPGNRLTITAGADIASGAGVLVGSIFGVAETAIANGAQGVIVLEGIVDLPKAPSQAWTVGALIYWDAANSRCTNVAGSLKLIGIAAAAVGGGAGETTGRVRLNGAGITA